MVVVTVVNELDVGDGGHVGIANDDVAVVAGTGGLVTRAVVAGVFLQVCGAVLQVLGSSVDVPASFSRCSGSSLGAVWITASAEVVVVWVVFSICCWLSFTCSLVFTPCIILSNAFFASQYPSS